MKKSLLFLIITIPLHNASLYASEHSTSLTSQLMQPKVLVPVGLCFACSAAVVTRWCYKKNKASNPVQPEPPVSAPHSRLVQRDQAIRARRLTRSIATQTSPGRDHNDGIPEYLQAMASRMLKTDHEQKEREARERRNIRRKKRQLDGLLRTIQRGIDRLPDEQINRAQALRDTLIFKSLRHTALLGLPMPDPEDQEEVKKRKLQEKAINDFIDTLEQAGMQQAMTAARLLFAKDLTPIHRLVTELATESEQLDRVITIVKLLVNDNINSDNDDSDDDDSDDDEDADDERDDGGLLPAVRADSDFDGDTTSSERQ